MKGTTTITHNHLDFCVSTVLYSCVHWRGAYNNEKSTSAVIFFNPTTGGWSASLDQDMCSISPNIASKNQSDVQYYQNQNGACIDYDYRLIPFFMWLGDLTRRSRCISFGIARIAISLHRSLHSPDRLLMILQWFHDQSSFHQGTFEGHGSHKRGQAKEQRIREKHIHIAKNGIPPIC